MSFNASSTVTRAIFALDSLQSFEQVAVAGYLPREAQPLGADDAGEVLKRYVQLIVNNNILIGPDVAHFLAGGGEAPRDRLGLVLAPPPQARLQRLRRRRQDEDPDALRQQLAHLGRTLGVDLQQDVAAGRH